MDCNGLCTDDTRISIKVVCPGSYKNLPQKILIDNTKFKDICQKQQQNVKIAYNNDPLWFVVDNHGNMVEYPLFPVTGWLDKIPWDFEILKPFFEIYNITPTWVDCNFTWGLFDEETGHWTGAVGKVNS